MKICATSPIAQAVSFFDPIDGQFDMGEHLGQCHRIANDVELTRLPASLTEAITGRMETRLKECDW